MIDRFATLLLLATPSLAFQTNLVANGSFESPAIASGTWDTFPDIPGWTGLTGTSPPLFEIWNNLFGFAADDGLQILECDSSISEQFLTTEPGCVYRVSIARAPRPGVSSNRIQLLWDGQVVLDISASGLGVSTLNWTTETTFATAISTSTRLVLQGLGADPSVGMLVDDVRVERVIVGSTYCGPGATNSTGASGSLHATGSATVADNAVSLGASDLPQNAFAFFLASRATAVVPNPGGSQGTLCLGGQIGRYVGPGQVQSSGQSGSFCLALDLSNTPTPTGPVGIQPGETWYFQCWYRDSVGGSATSNLTDGWEIAFQ